MSGTGTEPEIILLEAERHSRNTEEPTDDPVPGTMDKVIIFGREVQVERMPPPTYNVFVGGLTENISVEDLKANFSNFGEIDEVRPIFEKVTGRSKNYAFVHFLHQKGQLAALEARTVSCKGASLYVNGSEQKTRLYVGNLPKTEEREELDFLVTTASRIMHRSLTILRRGRERVSSMVEYSSLKACDKARQRLNNFDIRGHRITSIIPNSKQGPVDRSYRNVYFANIPPETPEKDVFQLFNDFGNIAEFTLKRGPDGILKGYGFCVYDLQEDALTAIATLNRQVHFGRVLQASIARLSQKERFPEVVPSQSIPRQIQPIFYPPGPSYMISPDGRMITMSPMFFPVQPNTTPIGQHNRKYGEKSFGHGNWVGVSGKRDPSSQGDHPPGDHQGDHHHRQGTKIQEKSGNETNFQSNARHMHTSSNRNKRFRPY